MLEGALNVACSGATPIGITDCLNFGSPETDLGAWQLERAIDGIADACRALDLPVVSGNVSLYNETPDGPILPTPVVGTVGLLADRGLALPMAWRSGDEIWLIGDPADDGAALAALRARLAARASWWATVARHRSGEPGRPPAPTPRGGRVVAAAHDFSVGGLAVALARVAIAAGCGASVTIETAATDGRAVRGAGRPRGRRVRASERRSVAAMRWPRRECRADASASRAVTSSRSGRGRPAWPSGSTHSPEAWRQAF